MWIVVGVMTGGRLGWWLFYHHNIHEAEPWYEPDAQLGFLSLGWLTMGQVLSAAMLAAGTVLLVVHRRSRAISAEGISLGPHSEPNPQKEIHNDA
jgi:phosphatidylglycerol:prolipoprotein diacylglycerol transferase